MFPCLFASGLKIETVGLPKISNRTWEWPDTQLLCEFAHIHPAGSVSMAALQMAQATLQSAPPRANEPQLANQGGRIKVTPIPRWR